MDGFILRNILVKFIRILNGTVLHAGPAAGAFVFFNVAGFSNQRHLEVSGFAFYFFNVSIGEYLDVGMPADFDQLR